MKSKLIKFTIILLAFALGMFINKWMSLEANKQVVGKVVDMPKGEKVIQLNPKKEDYNCSALKKMDGTFLSFCVRKEALKMESGKLYVRGETNGSSTVYIDKNLDTCSIAHELGHTQGLDENKAYEISNLCYQLVEKGIWKN